MQAERASLRLRSAVQYGAATGCRTVQGAPDTGACGQRWVTDPQNLLPGWRVGVVPSRRGVLYCYKYDEFSAATLVRPPLQLGLKRISYASRHEWLKRRVSPMALIILRILFMFFAAGLATLLVNDDNFEIAHPWMVFVGVMVIAAVVVSIDMVFPKKKLDTISAVYFGLIVGIFLTYVVSIALTPLMQGSLHVDRIRLVMGMVLCYACVSLLMQTKDDFRFVIPYIEFAKEVKGLRPYLLDTSVVIDGRIGDVVETCIFDNQLIMPRFVLGELQNIADSGDKMRRARGRRGLDVLNRLRTSKSVEFKIYDRELPEMANQPVDMKLVLLAKDLEGKIITGDYNLNKVARLHNVPVINLNDVANALKPIFLPGERVEVKVVKPGEEPGQGIGYLDDGTMIVIENGRAHISEMVSLTVTSVLQTSAGRMIFGRFEQVV